MFTKIARLNLPVMGKKIGFFLASFSTEKITSEDYDRLMNGGVDEQFKKHAISDEYRNFMSKYALQPEQIHELIMKDQHDENQIIAIQEQMFTLGYSNEEDDGCGMRPMTQLELYNLAKKSLQQNDFKKASSP